VIVTPGSPAQYAIGAVRLYTFGLGLTVTVTGVWVVIHAGPAVSMTDTCPVVARLNVTLILLESGGVDMNAPPGTLHEYVDVAL
jgi:hypothetical protein